MTILMTVNGWDFGESLLDDVKEAKRLLRAVRTHDRVKRTMKARLAGRCPQCREPIVVGDVIGNPDKSFWYCELCCDEIHRDHRPRWQGSTKLERKCAAIRLRLNDIFAPDTAVPALKLPVSEGSAGHCAIVAAMTQRLLGGHILSACVDGTSHWYNRIEHRYVDLTGDQFGASAVYVSETDIPAGEPRYVRSITQLNRESRERLNVLESRFIAT